MLVFLLDQLLVILQLVVCPQLNHILFYFCFEVLGSIGVFEGVQSVFVVVARWRDVRDHEGLGVTDERLLQNTCQFRISKRHVFLEGW